MNCRETRRWMSPYLDSELGKTKTFEVGEHLGGCPECAKRFEAERRADELMRTRLEDGGMPDGVWSRISSDVVTPPWFRRLISGPRLAIAASVLIVAAAAMIMTSIEPASATPRIVDVFVGMTSENVAFRADGDVDSQTSDLLSDALGPNAGVFDALEMMAGHAVKLVSIRRTSDDAGREYYELRLNCCGQPVLVALARSGTDGLPSVFDGLDLGGEARQFDGVNVATGQMGGRVVVVASRHVVSPILSAVVDVGP